MTMLLQKQAGAWCAWLAVHSWVHPMIALRYFDSQSLLTSLAGKTAGGSTRVCCRLPLLAMKQCLQE
jgi:hypothetical protein